MTSSRKAQLGTRLGMLHALAKAIEHRDEIAAATFESVDLDAAIARVQSILDICESDARAVLDQQLLRWTEAERERLSREIEEVGQAVRASD